MRRSRKCLAELPAFAIELDNAAAPSRAWRILGISGGEFPPQAVSKHSSKTTSNADEMRHCNSARREQNMGVAPTAFFRYGTIQHADRPLSTELTNGSSAVWLTRQGVQAGSSPLPKNGYAWDDAA